MSWLTKKACSCTGRIFPGYPLVIPDKGHEWPWWSSGRGLNKTSSRFCLKINSSIWKKCFPEKNQSFQSCLQDSFFSWRNSSLEGLWAVIVCRIPWQFKIRIIPCQSLWIQKTNEKTTQCANLRGSFGSWAQKKQQTISITIPKQMI